MEDSKIIWYGVPHPVKISVTILSEIKVLVGTGLVYARTWREVEKLKKKIRSKYPKFLT